MSNRCFDRMGLERSDCSHLVSQAKNFGKNAGRAFTDQSTDGFLWINVISEQMDCSN